MGIDVEGVLEDAGEEDEPLVEELLADGEIAAAERRQPVADVVEHRYTIREREREEKRIGLCW